MPEREWSRRSGGHVEVESLPGPGTAFTLVLPLAMGDDVSGALSARAWLLPVVA